MLKKMCLSFCFGAFLLCGAFNAYAEEETEFVEEVAVERLSPDEIAAQAIEDYEVEGSLFERITTLEQEKLVMQLEKDRIQLDLELDRLSKEKIKVQQELEEMAGRSDRQQQDLGQELENAKAELEAQSLELKRRIESLEQRKEEVQTQTAVAAPVRQEVVETPEARIAGKYKLINVIGVGNQLQATIQDVSTGQNRRIAVGKQLDGYTIKSISLTDGIVFEKDGVSENLNVGR